jgi:hypothetical protein
MSYKTLYVEGIGEIVAVRDWDFFGPVGLTHYRRPIVSTDGGELAVGEPVVDLAVSTAPMINAALGAGGMAASAALLDVDGDSVEVNGGDRTVYRYDKKKKDYGKHRNRPQH